MALEEDSPQASGISKAELAADLLEIVSEIAFAVSLDGLQILYVNSAAAAVFQVGSCQISALDWLSLINRQDQNELRSNLNSIQHTESFVQEFRLQREEGEEVWVKGKFQLICGDNGQRKFIAATLNDLTRRLDAERMLEESQAIYRTLVESLPINVFRKDLDGKIVFANQRYCDELGLGLSQLIGKTDFDLFPEMAEKYRRDDAWVLETGLPFHDIESHPRGANDVIYVEVLKAPVMDATGRKIGIQGMFWDVTARKKAEQALLLAKEAAEAHSRSKSDFLANISHEIRTPLNGIIGITDLLLGSVREKEQREYLELIQNSSDSLLGLINEILDFSKIESGKVQLQSKRFSLRESLGDTIRSLAVRAHAKNLELCMSFDRQVPDQIVGDLDRLRQVLVNLVGNAIKFTQSGEIDFRVETVHQNDGKVTLQFSVRDTGLGIPQDKFETIFIEFEQVDTSSTRKFGGTGLGLAIASRLVRLMGGNLQVESELGKGSRFSFTADFHYHDNLPDSLTSALAGQNVLLIVPNATQRQSISNFLVPAKVNLVAAASIKQALAECQRMLSSGKLIDAVACDADLDQSEIVGFLKQVRKLLSPKKLPVLLLTRFIAFPLIPELSSMELVDEILIKPVKEHEFLTSLGWAMGRIDKDNDVDDPTTTAKAAMTRPLQVLLVEDNLVNQKLAIGLLKKGGHQAIVAENGEVAIKLYQQQAFDLVLLDIQMPVMDGYETCKYLRKLQVESGCFVPIIALTAHASQEDRARCLESGMDEYLAKPIRPDALFAAIESVTGHSSNISQPDQQAAAKVHAVDWQSAFETVGGDRQLLRELIQVFLNDQAKMLSTIDAALRKGDEKDLRISAHALKGALTHLGGKEPARLAMLLESMGKNGDLGKAQKTFEQLNRSLVDVLHEMNRFLQAK
jgi:PAS domain S-box-containing protein